MKLNDLDFIELLPVFMRRDPAVMGLAKTMNEELADPNNHYKDASSWDRIDSMPDAELDELAWEFDVDWYDYGASHEAKVSQIKNALRIKKRRGTNWAVTQILADLWGWAYTREWYEFGGEPYTFEVVVKDKITTPEQMDKLLALIDKAKNVRSILVRTYYLEEHKIAIELRPEYHTGPFHLPQCNDCNLGEYHVVGTTVNFPNAIEIGINQHEGTYTFPQCNNHLATQYVHQVYPYFQIQGVTESGRFHLPICGKARTPAGVVRAHECGTIRPTQE